MARAPEPEDDDDGGPDSQSPAELKAMLKRARDNPINCAVGMSADAEALLLLAHNRPAKTLAARMKKENDGAKYVLWGTAKVDAENNPRTVVFTLNKSPTGIARALKKTLVGTGYNKAELGED